MRRFIPVLLIFIVLLSGCSPAFTSSQSDKKETQPLITYENAFNYVKSCEENIIKNNKSSFNKLKESAAEVIIYSDEYVQLYCSFWSACEELEGENDSRFGKSKMRWQMDYTKTEWKDSLKQALEAGGEDSLHDEYYRIYNEEVFPSVKYRWENGID